MTDDAGIAFVEKARQVGVHNICILGMDLGRESRCEVTAAFTLRDRSSEFVMR